MSCNKLFEEIKRLNEKYIKIWEELCNIESPTTFKEGVDKCGAYVTDWAKDMGFDVEVCPQEVAGDVICITMNSKADAPMVCFSGHMDTVHPVGLFGYPPVHMDEEKIYGPGVTDCKGGIVAGMLAMEALKNTGFTQRPARLLIQTDEEMGSRISKQATINYICEKAKDAVAFLNLEGISPGNAVIERKGILTIQFSVKGIKAHSARCADLGANAIAEAAYKIIEMEKLKDDAGLTCNCGVISGGTVPNTVPDECTFKANIRFANKEQYDWVMDYARKVSDEIHVEGCTCEISVAGFRPAMEKSEKNSELLSRLNKIYTENGMPYLEPLFAHGGSDAAYTTIAGIPTVDSLGISGGRIHSEEEWAYTKSLEEAAQRVGAAVYSL